MSFLIFNQNGKLFHQECTFDQQPISWGLLDHKRAVMKDGKTMWSLSFLFNSILNKRMTFDPSFPKDQHGATWVPWKDYLVFIIRNAPPNLPIFKLIVNLLNFDNLIEPIPRFSEPQQIPHSSLNQEQQNERDLDIENSIWVDSILNLGEPENEKPKEIQFQETSKKKERGKARETIRRRNREQIEEQTDINPQIQGEIYPQMQGEINPEMREEIDHQIQEEINAQIQDSNQFIKDECNRFTEEKKKKRKFSEESLNEPSNGKKKQKIQATQLQALAQGKDQLVKTRKRSRSLAPRSKPFSCPECGEKYAIQKEALSCSNPFCQNKVDPSERFLINPIYCNKEPHICTIQGYCVCNSNTPEIKNPIDLPPSSFINLFKDGDDLLEREKSKKKRKAEWKNFHKSHPNKKTRLQRHLLSNFFLF